MPCPFPVLPSLAGCTCRLQRGFDGWEISQETVRLKIRDARMFTPVAHVLASSAADTIPQQTPLLDMSLSKPIIISAIPGSRH